MEVNATNVIMHPLVWGHVWKQTVEKSTKTEPEIWLWQDKDKVRDKDTEKYKDREKDKDKPDMWVRGRYTAAAERPASCSIPAREWASKQKENKPKIFDTFECKLRMINNSILQYIAAAVYQP